MTTSDFKTKLNALILNTNPTLTLKIYAFIDGGPADELNLFLL